MKVVRPRPDAARWARGWPYGPAVIGVAAVLTGTVVATTRSVDGDHGGALTWLGGCLLLAALVANAWRVAVERLHSTETFGSASNADEAYQACRTLITVGLDFLVPEAWANLARASRGYHHQAFDELIQQLHRIARSAQERDPDHDVVLDFTNHVRALDARLREGPEELT